MAAEMDFKKTEATITALVKDCLHGVVDVDTAVENLTSLILDQATQANDKRRALFAEGGIVLLREERESDNSTGRFSLENLQDVVFHEMWLEAAKIPVQAAEDYLPLRFLSKIWTMASSTISWIGIDFNGDDFEDIQEIWAVRPRRTKRMIVESTFRHVVKSYYSECEIERVESPEQFQEWLNLSAFLACLLSKGIVQLSGSGLHETKFLGNQPPYNYEHEHSEPWIITAAQWPIYAADTMWEGANKRCFGNLKWWASWKRRFLMVSAGHGEFKRETRQIALEAYDAMVAAEAKDYKTLHIGDTLDWEKYRTDLDEDEDEDNDEKGEA